MKVRPATSEAERHHDAQPTLRPNQRGPDRHVQSIPVLRLHEGTDHRTGEPQTKNTSRDDLAT